MLRERFTVEQIIIHLREAKVLLSQGQTVGTVCRRIGGVGTELRDELLSGEILYTLKVA